MTTCVLVCEVCSSRKPFPLEEVDLNKARNGSTLQRHCPACRAVTNWMFTSLERRVTDRRQTERRGP